MDAVDALSKTFLFKNFPRAELEKVASIAHEESAGPASGLFTEGEPGDALYVIIMGTVKVMKRTRAGDDEEVAQLGSGSYFGEMALVDDDHKRSASIVTTETCRFLRLDRDDIERLCAKDDTFAKHLYFAVARGISKRLSATTTDASFYRAIVTARG